MSGHVEKQQIAQHEHKHEGQEGNDAPDEFLNLIHQCVN
jgi:hypothetical protein